MKDSVLFNRSSEKAQVRLRLRIPLLLMGHLALFACTCPGKGDKAEMTESEMIREVNIEPTQCRWLENYKGNKGGSGDKAVAVLQRAREIGANVIFQSKDSKNLRKFYNCPKILENRKSQ